LSSVVFPLGGKTGQCLILRYIGVRSGDDPLFLQIASKAGWWRFYRLIEPGLLNCLIFIGYCYAKQVTDQVLAIGDNSLYF